MKQRACSKYSAWLSDLLISFTIRILNHVDVIGLLVLLIFYRVGEHPSYIYISVAALFQILCENVLGDSIFLVAFLFFYASKMHLYLIDRFKFSYIIIWISFFGFFLFSLFICFLIKGFFFLLNSHRKSYTLKGNTDPNGMVSCQIREDCESLSEISDSSTHDTSMPLYKFRRMCTRCSSKFLSFYTPDPTAENIPCKYTYLTSSPASSTSSLVFLAKLGLSIRFFNLLIKTLGLSFVYLSLDRHSLLLGMIGFSILYTSIIIQTYVTVYLYPNDHSSLYTRYILFFSLMLLLISSVLGKIDITLSECMNVSPTSWQYSLCKIMDYGEKWLSFVI
ncbi:hypothetical protein NEFER03_0616 [Nematocida sp. LUAm3]|nr:hypothetical protein NEFER03_0616 [Nematocida sp. LUAm3]KAI5175583.1 hypothetical protein NEFER02_1489 [Nematocida sp. LUAm2]KAI5178387.1 hypothetical protein NEFER01_1534 [Nematocida sp. LUAm1]